MARSGPRAEAWRAASWLALLLAGIVATPGPASAWTEAAVRSVDARLRLQPDASAHVTLIATVRVHGGWLEGLELAGLDPDLELDASQPPFAVDEAGDRYQPTAEVMSGGRVLLSFRGRSPRRGRVTVTLAYRTTLAHRATEVVEDGSVVRVRWGLPGWRSGLDGVGIEVLAPTGARLGPGDGYESPTSVTTERRDVAEGSRLRWRRAHLPRTTPWTVAIDVPADAMAEELRTGPAAASAPVVRGALVTAGADRRPVWVALALLLALLGGAKMLAVHRLARRAAASARPLVPLPALVRAPLAVAACVAAGLLGPSEPWLALTLLALASLAATYRVAVADETSRLGSWHPVDRRWLHAARRARWARHLAPGTLLDGTTVLGAAHLASWLVVPFTLGAPLPIELRLAAALLPLPVLLTGTRLAFPLGPADRLSVLLRLVARMRALPTDVALCPVAHVDVRGVVQDTRVRTVLAHRPRGLLRLDLTLGERPRGGHYERAPKLLVLTREGSPADLALAERLPELESVTSPGGRRVVRLAPLSPAALQRIVDALADCPEAAQPSRGTSVPQETIRDLPAPRAVGL
jgi:hypothetical protein